MIATTLAKRLSDILITEAGFGADLGSEKYLNIASRAADIAPDAVVLVAAVRALKMHGGVAKSELSTPYLDTLRKGIANLERHLANVRRFGVEPVVAVNKFGADSAK